MIIQNPKSEYRNPKQIQISKFKFFKRVLNLRFWSFDIVSPLGFTRGDLSEVERSDLEIRNSNFRPQGGYIALIALLIIAAVALTIGTTLTLAGIDEMQLSYAGVQAAKAKSLANTCVEEGLERLRKNWVAYAGSLSIDGNLCIINAVINGNNATITATGSVGIFNQRIQVQLDHNFNIIFWQEE